MSRAVLGHADGKTTDISFPEDITVDEAVATVTAPLDSPGGGGIWVHHSTDPAPAWVAAVDSGIAAALAAHYDIPVQEIPT